MQHIYGCLLIRFEEARVCWCVFVLNNMMVVNLASILFFS